MIQKHINNLLGMSCQDKVTGIRGIITSMSFDLYGCIQVLVHPGINKDGELKEEIWFDISRLKITSKNPVMDMPDFEQEHIAEGTGSRGTGSRGAGSRGAGSRGAGS